MEVSGIAPAQRPRRCWHFLQAPPVSPSAYLKYNKYSGEREERASLLLQYLQSVGGGVSMPSSPFDPFILANGFAVLDGGLATELEAQVNKRRVNHFKLLN